MAASILIIGHRAFWSALLPVFPEDFTCSVETAIDPEEASPLVQAQQPDLLLLQASQPGSLELCHQLKTESRLAWIYCIVIDDRAEASWMTQIEALDAGADAYLQASEEISANLLKAQIGAGLRRVQNHRELMRTNDVLSAIALCDPLTELSNRRALEWELPRQIQSARSRNVPISLMMLDVDHFKLINDTHGHLIGDRALQLLSTRLRHNLRFYDTPFRYGGEEFVIILRDTTCAEAAMIAQRLCQLIREQPFAMNECLSLTITVSAGTASLRPQDDSKGTSLLHRADQRLLQAKVQGRDRVVTSQDSCGVV